MLSNWDVLLFPDPNHAYFGYEPSSYSFLAAVAATFSLAALFLAFRTVHRKTSSRRVQWILELFFLLTLLPVIDFLRSTQGIGQNWLNALSLGTKLVLGAVLLGFCLFTLLFLRRIAAAVFLAVLVLSPFAALTGAQAIYRAVTAGPMETRVGFPNNENNKEAAFPEETGVPSRRRVVWVIFDSLDRRVLFGKRPEGPTFENFDDLRRQSIAFAARHAGPVTDLAIPGLLTGRRVAKAEVLPSPDLRLTFEDGTQTTLTQTNTLFRALGREGKSIAVLGFHHPYCRLFGDLLNRCRRLAMGTPEIEPPRTFSEAFKGQLRGLHPLKNRIVAIETYRRMAETGPAFASDPSNDLVFLHVSVPHYPNIFDASRGDFTLANVGISAYFDNVALADRYLGRLREAMRKAGVWRSTMVVVSADHGWGDGKVFFGSDSDQVPFLVRLPGQQKGITLQGIYDALLTRDLILEYLGASLSSPKEVRSWLSENWRLERESEGPEVGGVGRD